MSHKKHVDQLVFVNIKNEQRYIVLLLILGNLEIV